MWASCFDAESSRTRLPRLCFDFLCRAAICSASPVAAVTGDPGTWLAVAGVLGFAGSGVSVAVRSTLARVLLLATSVVEEASEPVPVWSVGLWGPGVRLPRTCFYLPPRAVAGAGALLAACCWASLAHSRLMSSTEGPVVG